MVALAIAVVPATAALAVPAAPQASAPRAAAPAAPADEVDLTRAPAAHQPRSLTSRQRLLPSVRS